MKKSGIWQEIHDFLVKKVREIIGKNETPSVGIIDSQSVKTGMFKKVCQTAFLVQLNFQSIWKENIKLRHS
ncbi:hypothetical protein [Wolbachia endosymbiont (group A) of Colletes cunicularius]|uniref:hypothetical protein n=1 Tax=Wolbachia endosymbiont (group A) of Colletes cunicularius TaxID=3139321 RepID=UPI0035C92DA7